MNQPQDFRTLDRFLSGEADAAEREAIERRAARDPAFAATLVALGSSVRADDGAWDVEAAWRQLERRKQKVAPSWTRRALIAAAVSVVAIGLSVLVTRRELGQSVGTVAATQYATSAGESRTITLPDGSTITLTPKTELSVPATYGERERDVYLTGEAFFDVKPDARRPFVVHAGDVATRVLGTSFAVSTYGQSVSVEVVVVTGRVQVGRLGSDSLVLMPGQRGAVGADGAIAVQSNVDLEAYTGWAQGRLVFRDVTFAEAATRIERWYDVELEIPEQQLAESRLTAYLDRQEVGDILEVLAATLNAGYERTGRIVTFQSKR